MIEIYIQFYVLCITGCSYAILIYLNLKCNIYNLQTIHLISHLLYAPSCSHTEFKSTLCVHAEGDFGLHAVWGLLMLSFRTGLCNPHIQFKKSIFKPASPLPRLPPQHEGERLRRVEVRWRKDRITINIRRHFPISLCPCVKLNFCLCTRFHWLRLTALTAPVKGNSFEESVERGGAHKSSYA